jgi:lipoate-protein ligase B
MTGPGALRVLRLGRTPYLEAAALQARLEAQRLAAAIPDTLVVLEHPPVITLGHRGNRDSVLVTDDHLARLGIEIHRATRGGDATYHGPGQVVAYPVVGLRDLRLRVADLVTLLEEAMIRAAAAEGVEATRLPGKPGVFVGRDKIGAVGLHVSRGVTTHGLALNVAPTLAHFELIVPCGLRDHGVTSLAKVLGRGVDQAGVEASLVAEIAALLGLAPVEGAPPSGLGGSG